MKKPNDAAPWRDGADDGNKRRLRRLSTPADSSPIAIKRKAERGNQKRLLMVTRCLFVNNQDIIIIPTVFGKSSVNKRQWYWAAWRWHISASLCLLMLLFAAMLSYGKMQGTRTNYEDFHSSWRMANASCIYLARLLSKKTVWPKPCLQKIIWYLFWQTKKCRTKLSIFLHFFV